MSPSPLALIRDLGYAGSVKSALQALLLLAFAAPSWAGEVACNLDRGVLIAPAEVMGVTGDFVIDTGEPRTLLAETQAQAAGFKDVALKGSVRLAGVTWADRPIAVADLDARTVFLATPVAGVIGVDLLRERIVDVSFAPCRLAIHDPGAAPAFNAGRLLEMGWASDLPVVQAAVADGAHSWPADFTPATGMDLSLRLDDRVASAPAASKPQELYPGGVWRAPLANLIFAGDIYRDVDTGLMKGTANGPPPAGLIGGRVLSHYRLRFDFPAGRLYLTPAR